MYVSVPVEHFRQKYFNFTIYLLNYVITSTSLSCGLRSCSGWRPRRAQRRQRCRVGATAGQAAPMLPLTLCSLVFKKGTLSKPEGRWDPRSPESGQLQPALFPSGLLL